MPDVKGLMNDPEFQKLPMGTQKSTLGQLDPEFATLSDGDFVKFRAGMVKGTPSALEKVGGYLKSLPNPLTFKPNYGPGVQDVDTGPSYGLMKMAAPGTAVMQGVKGLFAKGAEGAPSAAGAVANKIPQIPKILKPLAKRLPFGIGTAVELIDLLRTEHGPELESLTGPRRSAIVKQFFEENHGFKPTTGREHGDAIREFNKYVKTGKMPEGATKQEGVIYDEQGKPFAKKGTAAKGDTPMESIGTPPATPGLGAKIGKQYPKQAPPGDMRRQVFVNLKTALKGEGGGTVTATENKTFRALVEKTYGKRVSAMTDAELDRVMRDIPKLAEQMRTGAGVE